MLNAYVSHEVRNPVNSIKSLNIEKFALVEGMLAILNDSGKDLNRYRNKFKDKFQKILRGTKA